MKTVNYLWIKSISDWIVERFTYVNPDIALFIACQCAMESSYGKSVVALENYNIIGMKLPKNRLTCAIGEKHGHACYSNVYCSVMDFFYWLQWHGFNQRDLKKSLETYLKRFSVLGYCPSDNYINSIQSIYQSFKSYKDETKIQ